MISKYNQTQTQTDCELFLRTICFFEFFLAFLVFSPSSSGVHAESCSQIEYFYVHISFFPDGFPKWKGGKRHQIFWKIFRLKSQRLFRSKTVNWPKRGTKTFPQRIGLIVFFCTFGRWCLFVFGFSPPLEWTRAVIPQRLAKPVSSLKVGFLNCFRKWKLHGPQIGFENAPQTVIPASSTRSPKHKRGIVFEIRNHKMVEKVRQMVPTAPQNIA